MATRKESDGRPQITGVAPTAAIPGGEFQIRGKGLSREPRSRVLIGDVDAPVIIGSDSYMVIRVPEGASAGELIVSPNE
ncbi:MAG TPA: IPT/TIG domain-containing protein, partial [Bryobacteraceae bacterium]